MKLKKNLKERNLFCIAEKKKKIAKYFLHNSLRSVNFVGQLPVSASVSKINNICLFTGRTRSVYRGLKVSRIFLKTLYSSSSIFGLKKASW